MNLLRALVGALGCLLVVVLFFVVLLVASRIGQRHRCDYLLAHNEMLTYNEVCR